MDNLFNFIKERVIDVLRKSKKNRSYEIIEGIIVKIQELENLRQLISYIEHKLINHHKALRSRGIQHNKLKNHLLKEKGNKKLNKFLLSHNISTEEIFKILNLPYKERRSYLIKKHKQLAKVLKDEDITPFRKKRKIKSKASNRKIRLIYTPMGNKMR